MIEQIRRVGTINDLECVESLDTIFDYFAHQVFASASAPTRDFLLRTAALPRMTPATAREISGQADASRVLDHLYRRSLFTDRRLGEQPTYQYHALFRSFLEARALEQLGAGEWVRISRHAGQLLEAQGLQEDAIEVYRSIQDWDSVIRIIRACAQTLLAHGRWQTLRDWIDALPPTLGLTDAWLPYWYGTALLAMHPTQARKALEQAYGLFAARGDVEGQLRSTSGIIEARFLETVDHRLLDPWLLIHERLLGVAEETCPAAVRLQAHSAMLIGTLYRQPGNPGLKASVAQTLALLDSDLGTNEKLAAASFLLVYTGYTGDFDTAAQVIPLGATLAERPEATAMNRGTWFNWLGYNHFYSFDTEAAHRALNNAARIAEEQNLQPVAFVAAYFHGMLERSLRHFDRAEKHLDHLRAIANGRSLIQTAIGHALAGWLAVRPGGDPAQAIEHGRAAWTISRQLGSPSYLVHWGTPLIYGLIERGQFEEGLSLLQEQREALAGTAIRCYDPLFLCVDATAALRRGDEPHARDLVSQMFAMARAGGYGAYLTRLFPWMPRLCELALEHGVEAGYVAGLVCQTGWPPASQAAMDWPWRWRVSTLGRFELVRDGQPLEFGRKSPKRPLALLRALIAAGPGGAPVHALSDHLWSDHEADRAHHSLEAAVHRLRRLLGDPDLVQLKDNRVSLDAGRMWVDAWAFEELTQRHERARQLPVAGGDLWRAISLYRGKFLPDDEDAVWTLSARERLRDRFVSCVGALGRYLENAGDPTQAIDCYRRGIETDDLAEGFYQGLMRCYGALGMAADGMIAYRRMRENLSAIRGALPSPESEILYRRLSSNRERF
jgi:DNA-binding SARP family transcriptional activator